MGRSLLWNLTANAFLLTLTGTGCQVIAYADDIATGQRLQVLSELLQNTFCLVNIWSKKSGLSVNPTKTEKVLFTRKYKISSIQTSHLKRGRTYSHNPDQIRWSYSRQET